MAVKPIPDDSQGITPYLICKNAASAIDFYKRAFGAREIMRIGHGDKVGHAEMKIGDAGFMLADEFADMDALSPQTIGGTGVSLYLYVEDVDSFTETAIAEGLKVLKPVSNQFYGDRSGHFEDPFGHRWGFATHIEDLTPEELDARAKGLHSE